MFSIPGKMRLFFLLTAVVGLSSATQYLDIAAINALPPQALGPAPTVSKQRPTYNPSSRKAAAATLSDPLRRRDVVTRRDHLERRGLIKRAGNCATYAQGYAPKTSPDTVDAFFANPVYTELSSNATTPEGYNRVFENYNASVTQPGYMGVMTYQHYNVIACQRACDAAVGCTAFNTYIERSPSRDAGAGCPNPPAVFNYRCTLWGLNITTDTATNAGQYRGPTDRNGTSFHTVITASNGYVKNAPPPSYGNFTGPIPLAGAIQPPSGSNTYIGQRTYTGIYDPLQCASACQATTVFDRNHLTKNGTYTPCNFFNSFVVSKNNVPQGTTCYFFSSPWDPQHGSDLGQYDQEGNSYTVSSSFAYTLTIQDSGIARLNNTSSGTTWANSTKV